MFKGTDLKRLADLFEAMVSYLRAYYPEDQSEIKVVLTRANKLQEALSSEDPEDALADLSVDPVEVFKVVHEYLPESEPLQGEIQSVYKRHAEAVELEKRFPPVKKDLHELDKMVRPSEDVLVKVDSFVTPMKGRYFHGIEEWQIDGVHGNYKSNRVTEWWPMPEIGTGIKLPEEVSDV